MINQIKADLFRIFRGKAIYITILLMLVMSLTSVYMLSPGQVGLNVGTSQMTEEEIKEYSEFKSLADIRNYQLEHDSFDLDSEIIAQNNNLYYFFIVIVILVLCTDFSNKTLKNAISTSTSRKHYFIAKTLLIFGLCTLLIVINNYGLHFMNLLCNGSKFTANLSTITKVTFLQLPLLYGIISLLCCLAFVIRKLSLFNGVTIPFIMVFQLILMFISSIFGNNELLKYEFQTALVSLTSNPSTTFIYECTMLGCAYLLIFTTISYIAFKKADIK